MILQLKIEAKRIYGDASGDKFVRLENLLFSLSGFNDREKLYLRGKIDESKVDKESIDFLDEINKHLNSIINDRI